MLHFDSLIEADISGLETDELAFLQHVGRREPGNESANGPA